MRVLMICPELPRADRPGSMAPGARQIRSVQEAGIETQVVDMRGIPKLKYLQVLPKIRGIIPKVDLIHAHYGYCGWLALLGRKLSMRSLPIVMSFMGDDLLGTTSSHTGDTERLSRIQARWNARLSSRYDQVIVKSQQMADLIAPTPCHVIPNGIDVTVFQPVDKVLSCQQLGQPTETLKVLFPGNPNNIGKGYHLACEAIAVAKNILKTQVELIPLWGIHPDDVTKYMNACDLMLMTSFTEGSPNVIKEGLACNMKIVSVPVGDVAEMLTGVSNCHCTTGRDPEEVGKAVANKLSTQSSSNGRDMLLARNLTLEGVANRIIGVYELALKKVVSGQIHSQTAA